MSHNSEEIAVHLFRVAQGYYIYDMNNNALMKITESLYKDVSAFIKNQSTVKNQSIDKLIDEGYLRPSKLEKIEHPLTVSIKNMIDNCLHMLTLQVTQNCNLRCKYCVYSGSYINRRHTNKRMSFETAKKAIDYYMAHSSQSSKYRFGFYGGEPTLEIELIKQCVEYIKNNVFGKPIEFNITTNATLLNKDVLDFLVKHRFYLTISLDGSKEIQDKNRIYAANGEGTFDNVMEKIEWIKEDYPNFLNNVRFNMVIDPEDGYKKSNDFFMYDERVKDIFVTAGEKNDNNLQKKIKVHPDYYRNKSYEEFKAIAAYFRGHKEKVSPLVSTYLVSLKKNIADELKVDGSDFKISHPGGPCVPGLQRLFVNADGKFYPCERVNENSSVICIGDVEHGIDIEKAKVLLNVGQISESHCKKCWAFRFCNSCAAYAEDGDVLSAQKRLIRCESIRNSVERSFMSYCVLKDLKMDFEELEENDR